MTIEEMLTALQAEQAAAAAVDALFDDPRTALEWLADQRDQRLDEMET